MKFWRQTLRAHSVSVMSVTSFHPILVSLLPYFVSQGCMNSLQFKNKCLCYFTEYHFTTKTRHNTLILHFHVLSAVSGRNNSIVSLIVDVPIVILNSVLLFELIGSLINSCSRSSMRKLPSTRRENCLLHNFND